jgi:hypothetical protein
MMVTYCRLSRTLRTCVIGYDETTELKTIPMPTIDSSPIITWQKLPPEFPLPDEPVDNLN